MTKNGHFIEPAQRVEDVLSVFGAPVINDGYAVKAPADQLFCIWDQGVWRIICRDGYYRLVRCVFLLGLRICLMK